MNSLHNWVISLHSNEVELLGVAISASVTMLAAIIAVRVAFKQLSRQFEHKVIFEGWSDFQKKLFAFSNAFTDYSSKVQWLQYVLNSQDNPLVNKGNKTNYRQEKWQEISNSYIELQKAYVEFLRSFETHEVVFLPLNKMRKIFQEQYRSKIDDVTLDFMEKVFPEMYGTKKTFTKDELKPLINQYWQDVTDIQIYLDDFRIELQNVTVGKVLNKKVKGRVPDAGYTILTRNGLLIKKKGVIEKIKEIFSQ